MLGGNMAWGDESVRPNDYGLSRYFIGVSLCDFDEETVRSKFSEKRLFKGRKVHWHDMELRDRQKSISLINSLNLRHIVVVAESPTNSIRSERARRKCLEKLLPMLENRYEVNNLYMESRGAARDKEELAFIQGLRSRDFLNSLHYDFLPGSADARLWIPDQVLGAVGGDETKYPLVENMERYIIRF